MASKSSKSSVTTRNNSDIWLIGQVSQHFKQNKLPSIKEVLEVFFYYKLELHQTIKQSAQITAVDVLTIWEKASIPTQLKKHVIVKIEKYFVEWQKLKKNKENVAKRSEVIIKKEKDWKIKIQDLFDVAHADALHLMSIEEDKLFLLAQREKGRPGYIGCLDVAHEKKNAKKMKGQEKRQRFYDREQQYLKSLTEKCILSSSTTSESSESSIISISSFESPDMLSENVASSTETPCRKRGRKKLIDTSLATSLDIAKLSDRKAAVVLTNTLRSAGCDPTVYNVNSSSIRRHRMKQRQAVAESLKSDFKPDGPLTIHWDGKLIEDISGHETVDRLPILVSGQGVDQLLSVPKLPRGTGEVSASAVYETIIAWDLSKQIKCMCFDTTAVNTGQRNGACIILEQKMEKDMLWLACRHHIMEIMLEAVVVQSIGPSSGPDILLFKRFKQSWTNINKEAFDAFSSDISTLTDLRDCADELILFCHDQIEKYQPREDYKELLNLCIIFLGGVPKKGISFRAPAGLHRARWMAKAIYSVKIFLFRKQFKLTKREEKGIKDICIFVMKIYIQCWFQAPSACSAPRNDLQLLKELKLFEKNNMQLSKTALKKFQSHLWYLSEELVAFAFFDEKVSTDTKKNMVAALENEAADNIPKRISLDINTVHEKQLEFFVSKNTFRFFIITGISSEFLKKDVDLWDTDNTYLESKAIVQHMKVVNDIAERGVSLIEEYNKLHTTNEEQKQYLLLLVKQYRQKYLNTNKSTLLTQI